MPGSTIEIPSIPKELVAPIPPPVSIDTFPTMTKFEAMDFVLQLVPFAIVEHASWKIVLANRPCEDLFGYNLGEMSGKSIHDLVPDALRHKHTGHVEGFSKEPLRTARPMGQGLVVQGQHRNGTVFPVNVSLYRFFHRAKEFVLSMIVDMRIGSPSHPVPDQSSYSSQSPNVPPFSKEKHPRRRSEDQAAPDSPKTGGS